MNSLASEVSYRLTSNSILTSNLYVFSYLVPSGADTPPQCMLGDTGNKRAVCILLECILVKFILFRELIHL